MSTASQGRDREHRVAADMETRGWAKIMRAAGSKGAADLAMAHPVHGLALVQVGTASKTLRPAERQRLLEASALCSALPVVCQVIEQRGQRTEYLYWLVGPGPLRTWGGWRP